MNEDHYMLRPIVFCNRNLRFLLVLLLCLYLPMFNGCMDKPGGSEVLEQAVEGEAGQEVKKEELAGDAEQEAEKEEVVQETTQEEKEEAGQQPAQEPSAPVNEIKFSDEAEEKAEAAIPVDPEKAAEEEARKAAEEEAERIAAEKEAARLEAEAEAKRIAEELEKRRLAFEQAKLYAVEVEQLTTKDCIRCHLSQLNRIVDKGGKHRQVLCLDCHREFHAYNPKKNNFKEIMPKCQWCHDDPHGQERAVLRCLNCHTDPHQPVDSIPDPSLLEENCRICHAEIGALLDESPSKHTQQPCSSCHAEKHGRIPECSKCHQNHSPKLELKTPDCLSCHPVHTPLKISYPLTQTKDLCAGCHEKPYQDLDERITKHSALTCAKCHTEHGKIPRCQECHGEAVHDVRIHQEHEPCGKCHSIAHKLDK